MLQPLAHRPGQAQICATKSTNEITAPGFPYFHPTVMQGLASDFRGQGVHASSHPCCLLFTISQATTQLFLLNKNGYAHDPCPLWHCASN